MPADEPHASSGDPVRGLVERCLELVEERGEQAAVEEVCRAHPEHADEVRRRLAALRELGLLEEGGMLPETGPATPQRLGPFRLRARLGGGGMGLVYLAEQDGMARPVALKLVRPEHLMFDGARERFRREVAAIATLQHPGIVPAYAVGEEQGVPYLAMEYVHGATLEEVITELAGRDPATLRGRDLRAAVTAVAARREGDTTASGSGSSDVAKRLYGGNWVEACLRIAQQLAEALQHAHERGVMHRDIKPGNAMLTPDGRVLLLDFGLAVAQGATRMTRTGSHVGSLAYMPPEQLRGDAPEIDARGDVYGLGVTLYELLTLHAPFATDTTESTRARVLDAHPEPPRSLNTALPRDAETVCLTAMDKEPARRYAGAADLARDLANVLEWRPIDARRPNAALRARRWAQRHPTRAVALAMGAAVLVLGPAVLLVQQQLANERIRSALDEASTQRDEAHTNLGLAREAVDLMLTRVSEHDLADVPQMESLRRELLEGALHFQDIFLSRDADDPVLRLETARAAVRAGNLHAGLGHRQEAAAAFRRAIELARQLAPDDARSVGAPASETPAARALSSVVDPRSALDALGDALLGLSEVQRVDGELDASLASLGAATSAHRRRLVAALGAGADEEIAEARADLAETLGNRAYVHAQLDHADESLADHDEAVKLARERLAGTPDSAVASIDLVQALGNRANLLMALGRLEEAESALREALGQGTPVTGDSPEVRRYEQVVAASRANLAQLLKFTGRAEEAEREYALTIDALQSLHERFPGYVQTRRLLATVTSNMGVMLMQAGRGDEAEAWLLRSIEVLRALVRDAPDAPGDHANLGATLANLGEQHRRRGELQHARELLEESRDNARIAHAAEPEQPGWRGFLSTANWLLALTLIAQDEHEAARRAIDEMAALDPDTAGVARRAAALTAACIRPAAEDESLDEADRTQAAGRHTERALALITLAVEFGHDDLEDLREAADLAPIRDEPAFTALLEHVVGASADAGAGESADPGVSAPDGR